MKRIQFQRAVVVAVLGALLGGLWWRPAAAKVDDDSNQKLPVTVHIVVDGVEKKLNPAPIIVNDRTLVPFRAFGNVLGAQIEWDDDEGVAILGKVLKAGEPDTFVRVWPFSSDPARIEVSQTLINLDYYRAPVPPMVISDRVFIPFRIITDALNYRVEWDDATKTVRVDTTRPAEPQDLEQALETLSPDSNGRLYVDMPRDGFRYSPASIRILRQLILGGNDILDHYNRNELLMSVDRPGGRIRYRSVNGAPVADQYADHVIVWRDKYQATVLKDNLSDAAKRHATEAAATSLVLTVLTGGEALAAKTIWRGLGYAATAAGVFVGAEEITPTKIDHCISEAEAAGNDPVRIGVVYTPFGASGCMISYVEYPLSLQEAIKLTHRR